MRVAQRRGVALLFLPALLSGCFRYVPTPLSAVPLGEQVQVRLTPRAQVELSQRGTRVGDAVRGRLAERGAGRILIRVPVATQREGFFRSDIEQELPVAEADVLAIELRQFSGTRTALFVGGSAGGAALVVLTIIAASRNPAGNDGGGVEEIRIPLLRLSVR